MKRPLSMQAVLLLLGIMCTGIACAAGEADLTRLVPDPAHSFATATAGQIVVGIVGDGWAISFTVQRENQQMHASVLKTGEVSFLRGPGLAQYIRPAAGPPTPPLPQTGAYSVVLLPALTITSLDGLSFQPPNDHLNLALSRFAVAGKWFELVGPVRLPLRGPLP